MRETRETHPRSFKTKGGACISPLVAGERVVSKSWHRSRWGGREQAHTQRRENFFFLGGGEDVRAGMQRAYVCVCMVIHRWGEGMR